MDDLSINVVGAKSSHWAWMLFQSTLEKGRGELAEVDTLTAERNDR